MGGVPQVAEPRISVVIPTHNEASNLLHTLPLLDPGYEVIVVDGRSTDDTLRTARELRPDVVILRQEGHGKGDALTTGWNAATGDIVVTLDADGSADPAEIPRFVRALVDGADFAKGSRYLEGGGSADLTWVRSVGNRVLAGVVNRLFGTRYTDLCYGYNAFWRRCTGDLDCDADGFEIETQMNIRAATAGLEVAEVPSREQLRIHGTSNLRPVQDGLRILGLILRERRSSRRMANGGTLTWRRPLGENGAHGRHHLV